MVDKIKSEWDAFISHAWEDKEAVARPLAQALEAKGLRVWFDEFTLSVGDRLRRSIDRGLANSRYGIVILSPMFFAKEWPQKELDGLTQREERGEKVILPVWHNITAEQIRAYSPTLADRFAVLSDRGLDHVVAELLHAMGVEPRGLDSVRTTSLVEPDLVRVPAGPFLMGTSDGQIKDMLNRFDWAGEHRQRGWFKREQPAHEVTLPAFEIGRYPVTNVEYAAFVEATGRKTPTHWQKGHCPEALTDHPVVNVTWHDAQAFAAWLSGRTGDRYRLPTEAEWEKAARGQDGRLWPWGNEWDAKRPRVNCSLTGPGTTTPVGQYSSDGDSPYGCADMAGNVWEWCATAWQDSYAIPADDDSAGNAVRVQRGGSWHSANPGGKMRCAYRNKYSADKRYFGLGFRVVRSSE